MPTVVVHNTKGAEVSKLDLTPAVFEVEANTNNVRASVNRQLARRRQGTACTKSKGMLAGSNAKPWRQKGTGRARSGTRKSPLWRGGGTIFGPSPRHYGGQINRKVTRSAILSCLSSFAKEQGLRVVDSIEFAEPKTRQVVDMLKQLNVATNRVLILTDKTNVNLALSVRNLPNVDVINCENLNTYDLTTHDVLVATSAAIKRIEETYA
jgi:large subunit ribosomal protein L4